MSSGAVLDLRPRILAHLERRMREAHARLVAAPSSREAMEASIDAWREWRRLDCELRYSEGRR